MQLKTSLLVAFCAGLLLPACNSTSSVYDAGLPHFSYSSQTGDINKAHRSTVLPGLYEQQGMEISKVVYDMADTLQKNVFYYFLPDAPYRDPVLNRVKIVTMPRIAITSFVDTDTYENAGYLGRSLAEYFTNEMSQRAFEVTEFKITGSVAVAKDGDYILSRDWKKIAKDTPVKYLLGGTLTRNQDGVVVVARIVDMTTRQVIASSTGFIAYNLIPGCYRTAEKNCSFTGSSYQTEEEKRLIKYYQDRYKQVLAQLNEKNKVKAAEAKAQAERDQANAKAINAMTKAQVVSASGKPLGGVFLAPTTPTSVGSSVPTASLNSQGSAYRDSSGSVKYSPTATYNSGASPSFATTASGGYYEEEVFNDPRFRDNVVVGATSRGTYDKARTQSSVGLLPKRDPVVYPSNTYMHNTLLVRDTADESTYKRVDN